MAVPLHLLLAAPELAVLDALEATLEASACALSAAHSDLHSSLSSTTPPSPQLYLADSILTQVCVLQHSLDNYRSLMARLVKDWHSQQEENSSP